MNDIPYNNLTPDIILQAVESVGLVCNGRLLSLNSYENRVYQIGIEDNLPMVAKFYRPNRWSDKAILEEHQFAAELLEYEIPIVAPWTNDTEKTLHHYQEFRFALFPNLGGRAMELDNLHQLEWMGRYIGRLHAVSACRPFQHRQQLGVQNFGRDAYRFIVDNHFIPDYLLHNYCTITEALIEKMETRFAAFCATPMIRIHGDIHAGNVLWNAQGPHIVDLDDCMMGPEVQDLWMLLSGDEADVNIQLTHILRGYEQFNYFNHDQLYLIEALRALRMLHYAAWIARRWQDPAFPLNFPWFNTPTYWQTEIQNLREQLSLLE